MGRDAPDGDVRIVLFVQANDNISLDPGTSRKDPLLHKRGRVPPAYPSVILEGFRYTSHKIW